MESRMTHWLGVAMLVAGAAVFARAILRGLRSGTMVAVDPTRFSGHRERQPVRFWIATSFNALMLLIIATGIVVLGPGDW
jgi:hypothetical protein